MSEASRPLGRWTHPARRKISQRRKQSAQTTNENLLPTGKEINFSQIIDGQTAPRPAVRLPVALATHPRPQKRRKGGLSNFTGWQRSRWRSLFGSPASIVSLATWWQTCQPTSQPTSEPRKQPSAFCVLERESNFIDTSAEMSETVWELHRAAVAGSECQLKMHERITQRTAT